MATEDGRGEKYSSHFFGRNLSIARNGNRYYLMVHRMSNGAIPSHIFKMKDHELALGINNEFLVRDSGYDLDNIDIDARTGSVCYADVMFGSMPVTAARVSGEWYLCLATV